MLDEPVTLSVLSNVVAFATDNVLPITVALDTVRGALMAVTALTVNAPVEEEPEPEPEPEPESDDAALAVVREAEELAIPPGYNA